MAHPVTRASGFDLRGHVLLFGATAGLVAALTTIFRASRSVMAIGGSCASGGPYAIATPCPRGVPWLMVGSIWGGLALALAMSILATRVGAPDLAWLAWPGLFLSLGWNFWEFGLDPPTGEGVVWGWIACGAMFVVMGGAPVVLAVLGGDATPLPPRTARATARASAVGARVRATTTPPPFRPQAPGAGLVDELERLDALHRAGGLTDDEHAAAKRVLLGGGR